MDPLEQHGSPRSQLFGSERLKNLCIFTETVFLHVLLEKQNYSFNLDSFACKALVASSTLSFNKLASSVFFWACTFFSKKWVRKSFKPSRSIPSLGLSDSL